MDGQGDRQGAGSRDAAAAGVLTALTGRLSELWALPGPEGAAHLV